MMTTKISAFLAVYLAFASSCRQGNSSHSDEQSANLLRPADAVHAAQEWVVYYANEFLPYSELQTGGEDTVAEGLALEAFVSTLTGPDAGKIKAAVSKDRRDFPAAVKNEIVQLEARICKGSDGQSNTAGLVVFNNALLLRGKFAVCRKGQPLEERAIPSSLAQQLKGPHHSIFPTSKESTFKVAARIAREMAGEAPQTAFAWIIKSHAGTDYSLMSCEVKVEKPAFALALAGEVDDRKLGLEGCLDSAGCGATNLQPSQVCSGRGPESAAALLLSLQSQRVSPADLEAFRRRSGLSGNPGAALSISPNPDAISRDKILWIIDSNKQEMPSSMVFFDWLGSSTKRAPLRVRGGAAVWGLDGGGLQYDSINYSKLPGEAAWDKNCGDLDFNCSLQAQLRALR